ncbi:phosphotransferase family protein [Kutzneria kofuensis]|uniref:Aminoglycoside phosphotransferase (APT) family kinase protein n=1 Tax=Kutzneria kofuensis TaxID=103725 RepID=A0A7W9KNQ5_9PSEU|nr:phosphotransferase [Kutzneria kofuensis]MBB5895653.1 aminoglycoside phosphotransferase (APT) family kinase protein [Kutzneria kofuensis]
MAAGVVVSTADEVVKAHHDGVDGRALADRMRLAAHPALHGILLPPKDCRPIAVGDRWVSVWPLGRPVADDEATAPWAEAGGLLARLHRVDPSRLGPIPAAGTPARLSGAISRLPASRDAATVLAAWETVAPLEPGYHLVHGDWHLGQLVQYRGRWLLIDVDDLGLGDPGWDLGRIAAGYAVGALPEYGWQRFLAGYRAGHGPALPLSGDPWPFLEPIARAFVVYTAATALLTDRPLDDVDRAMLAACRRMTDSEETR